jgi:hypothetical protein
MFLLQNDIKKISQFIFTTTCLVIVRLSGLEFYPNLANLIVSLCKAFLVGSKLSIFETKFSQKFQKFQIFDVQVKNKLKVKKVKIFNKLLIIQVNYYILSK